MKAYALGFSARARADLDEIRAHLGPGRAIVLDEELDVAGERLSENPEMGPRTWHRGRRHPRYRRLILLRNPYHIYYQVNHARQAILIVRVWHEKRRLPKL